MWRQWLAGKRLFQVGAYQEAARTFEEGQQAAGRAGDLKTRFSFLNGLGLCRFATYQYREAIEAYFEARQVARVTGDRIAEAQVCSNIATLYSQTGEIEAARNAAEQGLALLEAAGAGDSQPQLLVRLASLRARQGDLDGAMPLFRRGIEAAERQGDAGTQAQACNQLGFEYLQRGRLEEAEAAMLRDFYLRRMGGRPDIYLSYRNLGMLRMAQGDYRSAGRLLDEAIASALRSPGFVPVWTLYLRRGQLRLAEGRVAQALADLRRAVDQGRRWRLEALPADAFRISADAGMRELYLPLVEAATRLFRRTGREELAREAFEAAEENRAASLRAALLETEGGGRSLPGEMGAKLAELHAAQLAALRGKGAAALKRVEAIQHELKEIELRAGLDVAARGADDWKPRGGALIRRVQQALGADEAYVGLLLGEPHSYLWTLTRDRFGFRPLAGRARIEERARRFSEAVRNGSTEAVQLGAGLYDDLFRAAEPQLRGKHRWLLAPDEVLFDAPWAALVVDKPGGRPVYLVERHSVVIVPGAHTLLSTDPCGWSGPFAGVSDLVYNTADPRWTGRQAGRAGFWRIIPGLWAATEAQDRLQLPRLPGSSREVRTCARAWNPTARPVLLEGVAGTSGALRRVLADRPAVLHLATHVLRGNSGGMIALALQPNGEPELLSPVTIRTWRLGADLVVLSGCSSGAVHSQPAAGPSGLTNAWIAALSRAWLAAGSGYVLASRWPVPDGAGELFDAFYRHLRNQGEVRRPDLALRQAQLEVLRSAEARSAPQLWAAHFVTGRR